MFEEAVSASPETATPPVEAPASEPAVKDETPARKAFKEIMDFAGAGESDEKVEEPKKAEVKAEASETETDPASSTEETHAPTPKVLKAKKGDADVEISDDAVFTVKVNKKEEQVPLRDLIRNYQGKIPWEKHYQQTVELERSVKQRELEISSHAARLKKSDETAQKNFKEIVELARTNPSEALMRACIKAGQSPTEVLRAVLEQSKATVAQLEKLSPEQVEVLIAQSGVKYDQEVIKQERERSEMTKKEQEEQKGLEDHIGARCQQHQILAGEYQASEELLRSALQAGSVKVNGMTPAQISDLIIDNILQYDRPRGRIGRVLKELAPDAANFKTIAELHEHLGGGDLTNFSDSDLNEIMRGVFGSNGASSTEEPVQAVESDSSRAPATKPSAPKTPQKQTKPRMEVGDQEDDPLSIDDIRESYRRMAS